MYHLLRLHPKELATPELSDILVHSLPLQQVESVFYLPTKVCRSIVNRRQLTSMQCFPYCVAFLQISENIYKTSTEIKNVAAFKSFSICSPWTLQILRLL